MTVPALDIEPRRILVLYWTPVPPGDLRPAIRHHLRALENSGAQHKIVYWHAAERAPLSIRLGRYDAVILHTTFLCMRWGQYLSEFLWDNRWVKDLDCIKIAIPQDEYDHAEVLDEWLYDWRVTDIFSNFGREHHGLLYPLMCSRARFHHAFTGYIDEQAAVDARSFYRPPELRSTDVVYRATHLPFWFGSHGQLKHIIADRAREQAAARSLRHDISTSPSDTLVGRAWFEFLASGRVVVGCESGSSVLDRRGEIKAAIQAHLEADPRASFATVSAALPKGWDSFRFVALSPRHFEAVITKTCQVLVEGRYDGVLQADRHYISVRRDLSNLGDALEAARDPDRLKQITECAYEEVYASGRYTYSVMAAQIDAVLAERPPVKTTASSAVAVVARWRGQRELDRQEAPAPAGTQAQVKGVRHRSAKPTGPVRRVLDFAMTGSARHELARALGHPIGRAFLVAALRYRPRARLSVYQLLLEATLLRNLEREQRRRRLQGQEVLGLRCGGGRVWIEEGAARACPPSEYGGGVLIAASRVPPSVIPGGLDSSGEDVELAATSALASLSPDIVSRALRRVVDAGSRRYDRNWALPGVRLLITLRALAEIPSGATALRMAARKAGIAAAADDIVKLSFVRAIEKGAVPGLGIAPDVAAHGRVLSLRTRLAVSTDGNDEVGGETLVPDQIVWDHSAIGAHILIPVALGKRITVWLEGPGVHEFTALAELPDTLRARVFAPASVGADGQTSSLSS